MPHDNAASESVITQQAPVEQSTSTAIEPQTETQTTSSGSIMDKLGIPAEAQAELKAHKPTEEPTAEPVQAEQPAEPTTAEADPEHEEPEGEPKATDWPDSAKERVAKLTKQKNKAKETLEALQEENEQLRATLENTQPITVAPTPTDLFADIQNPQQLEQRLSEWRLVRDWCRKHPQGYTAHEGTDHAEFVEPEVVAERLSKAEDAIMFEAPKKAVQLQHRQQFDSQAQQIYPALFDHKTEDYQKRNLVLQQIPGLINHPACNLMIGHFLRGMQETNQELSGNKPKGALSDPGAEKLRQAQASTPPIAPPVPSARSNGATPSRKKVDEAMNNVVQQGGSREALLAAIRAKRESGATKSDPRALVAA